MRRDVPGEDALFAAVGAWAVRSSDPARVAMTRARCHEVLRRRTLGGAAAEPTAARHAGHAGPVRARLLAAAAGAVFLADVLRRAIELLAQGTF